MRQNRKKGEGFAITSGGGSVRVLWVERAGTASAIWGSSMRGHPGQQPATQSFQRTPKRMLWLHTGVRSHDVKSIRTVTPAVTFVAAGGFRARLGDGCGGGRWGRMPWALVPRAAQVKVFLHLVVEHSCFGGPFHFV